MKRKGATAGDALVAIGKTEPEALKLVGDLMDYNARSLAATFEQLYEGEKSAHEETRARLRAAHRRLAAVERRVAWLLGEDALLPEDLATWDNS